MRRQISIFLAVGWLGTVTVAEAQWEPAFRTVADSKIHSYQKDSMNPNRILLGVDGGVMVSKDSGAAWKRVLTVPANQPVTILQQEAGTAKWWALAPHMLYRSADGGQKWEPCSSFPGDASSAIRSFMASDHALFMGRRDGLAVSVDDGLSWNNVQDFAGQEIFQISQSQDQRVWVAADRGVYRSAPNNTWERVYSRLSRADESQEVPDGTDESESVTVREPIYLWFGPGAGTVTVVDGGKKFSIDSKTRKIISSGLLSAPAQNEPQSLDGDAGRVAIAAGRGIGVWDESSQSFEELTGGWPGALVRAMDYDSAEDQLTAVTDRGVYKYEHPELSGFLEARMQSGHERAKLLIGQFGNEPNILELQDAAMRYAEVHPDKIIEWRKQLAKKAWFPTVSLGQDIGEDANIDLDRGGTADPDHFIQGPSEVDRSWSVDVSWALGDLIWNDDQTTIDNRSKLMVQLRDDLLNQLNHMYYSRRRIQIAMLVEGSVGLDKEIDRRLQIEEYTAGLDALTGGYFSHHTPGSLELTDRSAIS
jgi:photosystem II stability/assembly factor-like uncharacterized protein